MTLLQKIWKGTLVFLVMAITLAMFQLWTQPYRDIRTLTSRIDGLETALEVTLELNIKMAKKFQNQYDTIFEMYRYEMSESTAVNRDREERND